MTALGISIAMPDIAAHCAIGDGVESAVMEREMKCDNTVAAIGVGGSIGGVVGRSGVGGSVPKEAVAEDIFVNAGRTVSESQMQSHYAITTIDILTDKDGGRS